MNEDDWFAKAAREAEASERGRAARERAEQVERENRLWERERKITLARREAALKAATPPPRPAEAAAAAALFEAVAAGKVPLSTGTSPSYRAPRPGHPYYSPGGAIGLADSMRPPASRFPSPTPEQGLEAILKAIRKAGDADAVFKAGGEWISKITNAITEVIREADDEAKEQ